DDDRADGSPRQELVEVLERADHRIAVEDAPRLVRRVLQEADGTERWERVRQELPERAHPSEARAVDERRVALARGAPLSMLESAIRASRAVHEREHQERV